MGVDATFVFPVPQTRGENLGEARKRILNVLMMNDGFASQVKSRHLSLPPDLEGVNYPPLTESFLIVSCDHRFLSPYAPQDESSELRWENLKEAMMAVVDTSRLSCEVTPWYTNDLTVFDTPHHLALNASENKAHFVNEEFVRFMNKKFGSR